MSAQGIITRALLLLRCPSSTLQSHWATSRTRLDSKYLQNQVPCLKVWYPTTTLRAYFTKSQIASKTFTRNTEKKHFHPVIRFQNNININCVSVRHHQVYKKVAPIAGLQNVLQTVNTGLMKAPKWKWAFSSAIAASTLYLSHFYWKEQKKNSITGRKQFLILNDDEAIELSERLADIIFKIGTFETKYDDTGAAVDVRTQRLVGLMNRLKENNSELNSLLLPRAAWRPIVIKRNKNIQLGLAFSFQSGHIFVDGEAMDQMNDDELAFVLGHEMSHVVLQHDNETHGNHVFFFQFFCSVLKTVKEYVADFNARYYIDLYKQKITKPDEVVKEWEADEVGFMFASKACFDYRKFPNVLLVIDRIAKERAEERRKEKEKESKKGREDSKVPPVAVPKQPTRRPTLEWEDEILLHFTNSGFWIRSLYPTTEDRIRKLQSRGYIAKAEKWRVDSKCIPELLSHTHKTDQRLTNI